MKLNTKKRKGLELTKKRIIILSIVAVLVVLGSVTYIARNYILQAVLPKKYMELSLINTIDKVSKVYDDDDEIYDKKYYFELVQTDNEILNKVAANLSSSIDVIKDKNNHKMSLDMHVGIKGINFVNINTYTDGSLLAIDTNKKIGGLYTVSNETLSSYLQDKGIELGEYKENPLEKLFEDGDFLKNYYKDLLKEVKSITVSKIGTKEVQIDTKSVLTTIYRLENDKYCVDMLVDNKQNIVGFTFNCTVLNEICKITVTNNDWYDVYSKCKINVEHDNRSYSVEYSFIKVKSEVNVIETDKAISIDDIYNFDIKELIPDKVKEILDI